MQITITVPELTCTRCATTAPIHPHLVYLKSQVPEQLRGAFSDLLKEPVATTAVDDSARVWSVLTNDKPVGWIVGPQASDLCETCGALWLEASKAFLVMPPPPPIVVEEPVSEPLEGVVTEDQPVEMAAPPIEVPVPAPAVIEMVKRKKSSNRNQYGRRR
jgi:hypothetical protein